MRVWVRVFVDTAAWLALLNISDALHIRAQRVMRGLHQQRVSLVTTEFVLLEVADAFSAPTRRARTVTFINGLRQLPVVHIIPASHALFADSWTLYSNRLDQEWGLTDCSSFVVMSSEQITQAFTSDHHFEQAGFVKLL